MRHTRIGLSVALPILALAAVVSTAGHPAFYFNGFENATDVPPPASDDVMFAVTRAPSGMGGIPSAAGDWHAEAMATDFGQPDGAVFTRYGGYNSVFPADGYTTSIDIYLDASASGPGDDLRLDWSSAINNPGGTHRRDFIFHVGTDGAGGYVASVSNNAPGWPANPGRDPLALPAGSAWHTLQHRFHDDGSGVLAVDLSIIDAAGITLKTWTLSDATDIIGVTVGGNRYGWLVTSDFPILAMDNVTRTGAVATTKDQCKKGGWESVFRADGSAFKNQGDCIQYVNTGT